MPETAMQLRIQADHSADPDANGHLPPTGQVRIGHTPEHDGSFPHSHQFGMITLRKGDTQGWLDIKGSEEVILQLDQPRGNPPSMWPVIRAKSLVMHTIDGDVTFDVVRQPGIYADGELQSDHVALLDGGKAPDVEVFLGMDIELKSDAREWEGKTD